MAIASVERPADLSVDIEGAASADGVPMDGEGEGEEEEEEEDATLEGGPPRRRRGCGRRKSCMGHCPK